MRLHFRDIGHQESDHSVTYENAQARERTQVLMDVANQTGGIVLGTGDLSEIALGWCTYNADHMSMYGVNSGVPKTLVRWIVQTCIENPAFAASREVLESILDTPISPELLPPDEKGNIAQQTEDLVGPMPCMTSSCIMWYALGCNRRRYSSWRSWPLPMTLMTIPCASG